MILRERVTITRKVSGTPVPTDYRAEVSPMQSDEYFKSGTEFAASRLRVVLSPNLPHAGTDSTLTWRGVTYAFDGVPLPHVISGRVHHHEVIVKRLAD